MIIEEVPLKRLATQLMNRRILSLHDTSDGLARTMTFTLGERSIENLHVEVWDGLRLQYQGLAKLCHYPKVAATGGCLVSEMLQIHTTRKTSPTSSKES